jgi:REP element-mobilizing transposase RayT
MKTNHEHEAPRWRLTTIEHEAPRLRRALRATMNRAPMVYGYHFIFSAYGFWLPNDPRGSWSDTVREFELLRFGPATKVTTTRSIAHKPHDHAKRLAAKQALRYSSVNFTGIQARAVAQGFATAAHEHEYKIHALAILPDHVHMIMARHPRHIDDIAAHLKAKATRQLSLEHLHPLAAHASPVGRMPSPWSRNYWCPFIRDAGHMLKAIKYVERNPIKAGLKLQRWRCAAPYEPAQH